jgi:hypothetical protein
MVGSNKQGQVDVPNEYCSQGRGRYRSFGAYTKFDFFRFDKFEQIAHRSDHHCAAKLRPSGEFVRQDSRQKSPCEERSNPEDHLSYFGGGRLVEQVVEFFRFTKES